MPRLKKTAAQMRADRFGEHYRVGKARLQLHETDIAHALGVSERTLHRYRTKLDKLPFGTLLRIGGMLGWTEAEYMDIIRGGEGARR